MLWDYNWNVKGRENVIGALVNNSLTACGTVNGNVDSDTFNTWLEEILIPELPKNSVVIMDNAAFHKSLKTKEILAEHGHELEFLPPYSPDFNPIEHKWAQAKAIRRKHNCSTLELCQKYSFLLNFIKYHYYVYIFLNIRQKYRK